MFINTLPITAEIKKTEKFIDFIAIVKNEITGCFRHQKYPYDLMIGDLQKYNKSISSLFDIIFTYENIQYSLENTWHHDGNEFFPLVFHITEREKPYLKHPLVI